MIVSDFPTNLIQFQKQFGTEEACLKYIRKQRWGSEDGFECPKCKHKRAWSSKTREILICASCERHLSITAGTQFHKTRKSLVLWFMAMYLMNTSKRGISAKELQRQLGLKSYQTAWAWLHKLRSGMIDPNRAALSGFVEVDETYYDGMCEGYPGRSTEKKALVACAVEKIKNSCGRVRLSVIPNPSKETLKGFILGKIELESVLRTDGWVGYSGIDTVGYEHMPTKIGKKKSRTNEILPKVHRVFSLLKRWLLSTHQGAVSQKHLQAYLEEFTFRFNRRTAKNLTHPFQRMTKGAVRTQATPYWKIIGRTAPNVPLAKA